MSLAIRGRRRVLVVASAIVFIPIAFLIVAQWGRTEELAAQKLMATDDVCPVTLRLFNSPRISRARGHADTPLGVWGRNAYSYNGTIELDGQRFRYRSSGWAPFASFRLDGDLYLLTRAYFRRDLFLFYSVTPDQRLARMPTAIPDPRLRYLEFKDDNDAYFYKTWVLETLLDAGDINEAAECFNDFVDANPRFPFRSEWLPTVESPRDTEFADFVERVGKEGLEAFYDGLVKIADHSQAGDDSQIVRLTCCAIIELRGREGALFVKRFKERLAAEATPGDLRLSELKLLDEVLRDALGAP